MFWKDIIKDRMEFIKLTKFQYDNHVAKNLPDYNHEPPMTDFNYIKHENVVEDNAFENTDFYGADTTNEVYKKSYLGRKNIYHDHEWIEYLKNKWHFDYAEGIYYKQKPGQMVAPHVDKHTRFTQRCSFDFIPDNIHRYVVFLSDWQIGQTWMLGRSSVTDWKKFDVIKFPWYMPHATANVSTQDRELLTICAIKK